MLNSVVPRYTEPKMLPKHLTNRTTPNLPNLKKSFFDKNVQQCVWSKLVLLPFGIFAPKMYCGRPSNQLFRSCCCRWSCCRLPLINKTRLKVAKLSTGTTRQLCVLPIHSFFKLAVFKDLSSIHVCPSLTVTSRSLLRYTTNFALALRWDRVVAASYLAP